MEIFKFCALLFLFLAECESKKILMVSSTFSRSHVVPLQVLAKALAERDHDVTFISAFPENKSIRNLREMKVEMHKEDVALYDEIGKIFSGSLSKFETLFAAPKLFKLVYKFGNDTLNSNAVSQVKKEKFDLVIVGYFLSEFLLGLADHFDCPSIVYFSASPFAIVNKMVGNPLSPEGAHHILDTSARLDFFGRVNNFMVNAFDYVVQKNVAYYRSKKVYEYNFPNAKRSFDEIYRNISMVFVGTHFTSSGPRPNLPNMIEVGGLQIKDKPSPLPDNLKTFLDDAKDGAILLSFGSNVKSTFMPEQRLKAILKVFRTLKQRVIMKWENDHLEGKPPNVFISKWLPQDDILAHPKIKIFITHGGFGGITESKFHGVPIICIPFAGDQFPNCQKSEEEDRGIMIRLGDVSEKSVSAAIEEIFKNPKYVHTAKRLSSFIKDRPMSALDTAVYWTEYVLRHHGAPHLHYPGAELHFFQYNSVDVIAFIVGAIYLTVKVLKLICKTLICSKRKEQKVKLN